MTKKFLAAKAMVVAVIMASLIGCGDDRGIVPVSGTVTIDGKPVPEGDICLYPDGTRMAVGKIENGQFSLTSFQLNDGAPKGTHSATINANEYISDRECKWLAPKRYAERATSDLSVSIDGPTDDLKIDLTWEGSKKKGPYVEKF